MVRKRHSLATRLAAWLFIGGLVPLLLLALAIYAGARDQMLERARADARDLAVQTASAIDASFRSVRASATMLARDISFAQPSEAQIIELAREAGARKVYFASAAPPVRYPNVYGIDMPTSKELVAHGRTVEEVREAIGCDALIYQDVEAMKRAVGSLNSAISGFDASPFDGVYVTGDITAEGIARLNEGRVGTEENEEDTSRLALPNAQEA